jgi:hypothetical protein
MTGGHMEGKIIVMRRTFGSGKDETKITPEKYILRSFIVLGNTVLNIVMMI